jgi:hypothetical protein
MERLDREGLGINCSSIARKTPRGLRGLRETLVRMRGGLDAAWRRRTCVVRVAGLFRSESRASPTSSCWIYSMITAGSAKPRCYLHS